jgi:hypothetical protein
VEWLGSLAVLAAFGHGSVEMRTVESTRGQSIVR